MIITFECNWDFSAVRDPPYKSRDNNFKTCVCLTKEKDDIVILEMLIKIKEDTSTYIVLLVSLINMKYENRNGPLIYKKESHSNQKFQYFIGISMKIKWGSTNWTINS